MTPPTQLFGIKNGFTILKIIAIFALQSQAKHTFRYCHSSKSMGHEDYFPRTLEENKIKASESEASRLYELNLLAFVPNKFDFWGPKCPNYLNIEF